MRSETFQDYERAYMEATGMPLTLRPVELWQLPFHGKRKENAFCALMAGKSHSCAACLQLQEKLAQDAMNEPATRTCAYGLCETAVPVKLGLQTIGFLQTGQVMRQKPTGVSFQRAVEQAANRGADIDNEKTKRAYFKTPVASQNKLDAVSGLLAVFADHLAIKGNQLMVRTANAEPPIIARAKQFIREHYMEDLSLRQVASTVNTSVFYFCTLFRKCSAVSFTESSRAHGSIRRRTSCSTPTCASAKSPSRSGFSRLRTSTGCSKESRANHPRSIAASSRRRPMFDD